MAKNKVSPTPKNILQKPQTVNQATKTVKEPEVLIEPIPYTAHNFWILAGIIAVCALIAFLPGFQNSYVWDDMFYIVNNEDLRQVSFKNFKTLISDYYLGNWHPLTMVTYYIEYSLVKDTAWFIISIIPLFILSTAFWSSKWLKIEQKLLDCSGYFGAFCYSSATHRVGGVGR